MIVYTGLTPITSPCLYIWKRVYMLWSFIYVLEINAIIFSLFIYIYLLVIHHLLEACWVCVCAWWIHLQLFDDVLPLDYFSANSYQFDIPDAANNYLAYELSVSRDGFLSDALTQWNPPIYPLFYLEQSSGGGIS